MIAASLSIDKNCFLLLKASRKMKNIKPIRTVLLIALLFIWPVLFSSCRTQAKEKGTITFKTKDGLIITADLNSPHPDEAPFAFETLYDEGLTWDNEDGDSIYGNIWG